MTSFLSTSSYQGAVALDAADGAIDGRFYGTPIGIEQPASAFKFSTATPTIVSSGYAVNSAISPAVTSVPSNLSFSQSAATTNVSYVQAAAPAQTIFVQSQPTNASFAFQTPTMLTSAPATNVSYVQTATPTTYVTAQTNEVAYVQAAAPASYFTAAAAPAATPVYSAAPPTYVSSEPAQYITVAQQPSAPMVATASAPTFITTLPMAAQAAPPTYILQAPSTSTMQTATFDASFMSTANVMTAAPQYQTVSAAPSYPTVSAAGSNQMLVCTLCNVGAAAAPAPAPAPVYVPAPAPAPVYIAAPAPAPATEVRYIESEPEIRYIQSPPEIRYVDTQAAEVYEERDMAMVARIQALESEYAALHARWEAKQEVKVSKKVMETYKVKTFEQAAKLAVMDGTDDGLYNGLPIEVEGEGLYRDLVRMGRKVSTNISLSGHSQTSSSVTRTETYKVATFELAEKLAKMDGTDDGKYNGLPIEVQGEGLYTDLVRQGRKSKASSSVTGHASSHTHTSGHTHASGHTSSSTTRTETYKVKTFEQAAKLSVMDGTDDGLYNGLPIEIEGEGLYRDLVRAGRKARTDGSPTGRSQTSSSITRTETYKVATFELAEKLAKMDGTDDGKYNGLPIEVAGEGLYTELVRQGRRSKAHQ